MRSPIWTLVLAALLQPGAARAQQEVRLFLDAQASPWAAAGDRAPSAPGFFARSESRFRRGGLVYEKLSAGARSRVLEWLSLAAYYARHENVYADKPRRRGDLLVGDLVFQEALGPVRLLNREGNEWHVTDRYFEYRNLTEFRWRTPAQGVALFAYDEFRIDSDDVRVTFNDLGGGVEVSSDTLVLRVFYDQEASRRLAPEWQRVRSLAVSFAVRR